MKRILTAIVLASGPAVACAQNWAGDISAGLILTSGNTETRSMNGKVNLKYASKSWQHALYLTGINSADDESTTAERYTTGYKIDFNFTEFDYLFASADWEKDLYGGVRDRMVETVGYGRRLLNSPAQKLDLEIGGGARQQEFQQPAGSEKKEAVGRAAAEYMLSLSPTSKFSQNLLVESGGSNTFMESISELRLSVIGNLFVSLSFTARHNTNVAEGNENTDSITAFSLSYEFGKEKT